MLSWKLLVRNVLWPIETIAISLGNPPELEGKTLFLKTTHMGLEEIEVELTWSPCP